MVLNLSVYVINVFFSFISQTPGENSVFGTFLANFSGFGLCFLKILRFGLTL